MYKIKQNSVQTEYNGLPHPFLSLYSLKNYFLLNIICIELALFFCLNGNQYHDVYQPGVTSVSNQLSVSAPVAKPFIVWLS